MMVFASMLVGAAKEVNMKVPTDVDEFDKKEFPHFACFCALQLARPVVFHGEHWENAALIAAVPDDKITTMTLEDFLNLGIHWAQ